MKHASWLIIGLLILGSRASAQEEVGTVYDSEPSAEPAPTSAAAQPAAAPAKEEDDRSPYYKKVKGWLWIEATLGVSSYDPDKFGSIDFGSFGNAPKTTGPEYGFAVGTAFGGPFFLGFYWRQANFSDGAIDGSGYKLRKLGLDMQGNLRFIPYVHPIFRLDIGYATMVDGNPFGLSNPNIDGVTFALGVGVRIPIVRWVSFAATFDWNWIGLAVRSTEGSAWMSGQQLGGTFALTFHFIGVRRD